MIFLGMTFFSGKNSLNSPSEKTETITSIAVGEGVHNHLYVSKNPNDTVNNWDDDWNYDTVMNATFDTNLDAGNSGFSLRNTDTVIVRRREMLNDTWIPIYVKDINVVEDFDINILDRFARGGSTEYMYRISSILNGIENSYVEQSVVSDFDRVYVTDQQSSYGIMYNLDGCDTTRNIKTGIIETYNRYPTIVSNSNVNYESGSVSGLILVLCDYDKSKTLKYREEVKERLASKRPFVLKTPDGRIWMAKCVDSISDTMQGHVDIRHINFNWVEIGNVNDIEALYYNGLSDVPVRWW